ARDVCANLPTNRQIITVLDTIPPLHDALPISTNFQCLANVPVPANVTATDNCDTNPIVTFSAVTNGACPFIITRTWVARDFCGNLTTNRQVITVLDTIPPVLIRSEERRVGKERTDLPAPDHVNT